MMLRNNRMFTLVVLVALILGACQPIHPVVPQAVVTAAPTTPSFLRTACLYQIPPDETVECGFLLTREVHNDPTSRIIRLYVLIFKSMSQQPLAEPLIVLNGGPGSPNAPVVASLLYDDIGLAWRANHDVILIDQRGTNFSIPSLQCGAALPGLPDTMPISHAAQTQWEFANLQLCYSALLEQGVNLSAYNLLESAADIHDLSIALGYDQVKLYGYSYGSLLAMMVMRDYPEIVHSVVLDSVLPLGVDLNCEKVQCLQSGLDALFATCAGDPQCAAAYPALETNFWAVVDRLRATPVDVDLAFAGKDYTVSLDEKIFIRYILLLLLQQNAIPLLPATIDAAYQGDYVEPARSWISYSLPQEQSIHRSENSAAGLYYSTMCSYLAAFVPQSAAVTVAGENSTSAAAVHPALVEYGSAAFTPCTFWQVAPLDPEIVSAMAQSAIPTLLLVGKFDPGLAPYLSQSVIPLLNHRYYYELPISHGAIFSPCGLYLTFEFLTDPTQTPDASCIDAMTVNWVLPQ